MAKPDDIVGHKTFRDPSGGPFAFRHEPLSRAEAEAISASCDAADKHRKEAMPDEKSAIHYMFDGWLRLKDFGWREASYCPKDGSHFQAIEAGSTGVHDCSYEGEWPTGSWWLYDGDVWPGARPILFKLYPEDQAKYEARMEEAKFALAQPNTELRAKVIEECAPVAENYMNQSYKAMLEALRNLSNEVLGSMPPSPPEQNR